VWFNAFDFDIDFDFDFVHCCFLFNPFMSIMVDAFRL